MFYFFLIVNYVMRFLGAEDEHTAPPSILRDLVESGWEPGVNHIVRTSLCGEIGTHCILNIESFLVTNA